MFLHYLTLHKTKTWHWRTEAEAHWHLGHVPQRIIDKAIDQWQTWLRACV